MPYGYSDNERANLNWFDKDFTRQSLKAISIDKGVLRGLSKFKIEFTFPISAIAGKNGSGKSSVLALAACAFHNKSSGWRLADRKAPYYTFSDFFIQAAEDVPIDGISIRYDIKHNKWKPNEKLPNGIGLAYQIRSKNKGGKWNDYDKRVARCVAFLGIERVVPPAERSVYKSYRYSFSSSEKAGWEERVKDSVSRVLGVTYQDFEIKAFGKYRLPVVKRGGRHYSGFNMGAGEKALFEVFAAIFAAPDGALFLIDELELGLHDSAQSALIKELGDICLEKKIQVICTTHSPTILSALPPEGRFLIQSGKSTQIISNISPAYAAGRLANTNSSELTIFVEDEAACTLIESVLPNSSLQRARIVPIGSHSAVIHQMAARHLEAAPGECVSILDGDQATAYNAHLNKFIGYLGGKANEKSLSWIKSRLFVLPDNMAPEAWVFSELSKLSDEELCVAFNGSDSDLLRHALDAALLASEHNEVYEFSCALGVVITHVWRDACRALVTYRPNLFFTVREFIRGRLAA